MAVNERTADEDWVVYPVPQQGVREAGLDEDGRFRGAPLGSVYLRAPDIYFTILRRGERVFTPLKTLTTGVLGTKTGCDEFFVRTQEDVRALGLEEKFTRHGFWSPTSAPGFRLARASAPHRLVLIAASMRQLRGTNAVRYIRWAERKGLHTKGENERRAKTRGRWYDLSEQVQTGSIAFAKTYDQRHAVFWNPQRCVLGARFVSLVPHDDVDEEVLLALLNSSVTALFVEIYGRRSLGQGALDFAVYEARTLPVVDPRNLPPETADALRAAYRRLIERNPLPVTREVHAPDKQALDALVFDVLGLASAEREEVIAALVAKTTGRRRKARSVENRGRGGLRPVSDDDVLEHGLSDALSEVGLRRFPADFSIGPSRTVSVPDAASANMVPRIEAMMGEGVLVWPDGFHVEFEHIEAAQFVSLLVSLGWSRPIRVPVERGDAERALLALDAYVSLCCARFDETVRELAESEAQMKRVAGLFRRKLGEVMFDGLRGTLGVSG